MLGTIVDYDVHDDPASAAAATARAIYLVFVDRAPLSARPPILGELVEGISGIFLGMFFPLRIGEINAVGGS